jgi:hypothetical protein
VVVNVVKSNTLTITVKEAPPVKVEGNTVSSPKYEYYIGEDVEVNGEVRFSAPLPSASTFKMDVYVDDVLVQSTSITAYAGDVLSRYRFYTSFKTGGKHTLYTVVDGVKSNVLTFTIYPTVPPEKIYIVKNSIRLYLARTTYLVGEGIEVVDEVEFSGALPEDRSVRIDVYVDGEYQYSTTLQCRAGDVRYGVSFSLRFTTPGTYSIYTYADGVESNRLTVEVVTVKIVSNTIATDKAVYRMYEDVKVSGVAVFAEPLPITVRATVQLMLNGSPVYTVWIDVAEGSTSLSYSIVWTIPYPYSPGTYELYSRVWIVEVAESNHVSITITA